MSWPNFFQRFSNYWAFKGKINVWVKTQNMPSKNDKNQFFLRKMFTLDKFKKTCTFTISQWLFSLHFLKFKNCLQKVRRCVTFWCVEWSTFFQHFFYTVCFEMDFTPRIVNKWKIIGSKFIPNLICVSFTSKILYCTVIIVQFSSIFLSSYCSTASVVFLVERVIFWIIQYCGCKKKKKIMFHCNTNKLLKKIDKLNCVLYISWKRTWCSFFFHSF